MSWEQIGREWNRWKAGAKEQWAELTDRDLSFIAGNRQRLAIALHRRYGISIEQAQKRIEWWLTERIPALDSAQPDAVHTFRWHA